MASLNQPHFLVLGAGVIGLTTALTLHAAHPTSAITIVAKNLPGDRTPSYASPWAGANWCSFATDNGPLEKYDRITFERFVRMADGAKDGRNKLGDGQGESIGVGRLPMWTVFDLEEKDADILSQGTGKVWYEKLVGLTRLDESKLPKGAVFGYNWNSTFRINTQVYLQWLQAQALAANIKIIRREYPSLSTLLLDFPSTTLLINCSALGALTLTDVQDKNMYPTRGQTVLVAEPKVPIPRMYVRSPKRISSEPTYVFPRPSGGGVILGGLRQDGNWTPEVNMQLSKEIMERCCELCPELGPVEELQVISHNVGFRPSRKGGPRIELETWANGIPVVHNYGHSGAGYQCSWGTAERVLELVHKALAPSSKL